MAGILYGVGVGPGDPELMTLKAARLIRENEVIALPGVCPEETAAYRIAAAAVPELADKCLLPIYMPMTHNREEQARCHREGADQVEAYLREGKHVVYLTLGDPAVYATFTYLQRLVQADGFETQMVSGVPSFCAAAARTGLPIAIGREPIHILPAVHHLEEELSSEGTYVLMKTGSRMREVKELLRQSGRECVMVENCGMPQESVYRGVDQMPDSAGYYSLIIAREAIRG